MSKSTRWTSHATAKMMKREIAREEALQTLAHPEEILPGLGGRSIYQRRYNDTALGQPMLLRLVVEETAEELVVVTLYRTSKPVRYQKDAEP